MFLFALYFGAQREQTEELQVWWRGTNVGVLITYVDVQHLLYILVYKSNTCISQTLFLKPKIQLF